ncbi:MAG: hypothetical protein JWO86_6749 [Myxococcaceae bacterium]|jgi:hypothetical protein|nr:hypothetical protein [Myxococcaceae bacterium]MEA2747824.1 hypothetical protein [Myxococcales bacterium]
MATLSTTAWVLHELGLAAGFGGNLFGQLALNPAVAEIQSKRERGKVTHVAWDRYKTVNATSLALMASTWIAGRTMLSGREVGKTSRVLTITKDVLVGGALVGGIGALVFGRMLDREMKISNEPLQTGSKPASETKKRVADLQRLTNGFGRLNVVMNAAVLAVTTVLAMKAGKSSKWTLLSKKLLP